MSALVFELRPGRAGYPDSLETVPRPPRVLYGMGDETLLRPGLAVVGSRKASPYGLACARRFAGWAAERGVTIVSGAAIGCDLAAHTAALEAGAPTIAVLGCGADVDYPRSAASTLAAIRSGAGAVVSEFAWGTAPRPGFFPARNRIIAGLAAAVLVVEAALPSGTFSTADHALEAGREVFAVPGSVFYSGAAACNRLIRQGAAPITCLEDLLDSLTGVGLLDAVPSARTQATALLGATDDPLLKMLRAEPMTLDRLIGETGTTPSELLRALGTLEGAGLAARYPDGRYGACDQR